MKILSRSQPLTPPGIDNAVLDTVYECLMEGRKFSASYRRRGQKDAVIDVIPANFENMPKAMAKVLPPFFPVGSCTVNVYSKA
ncbi:hypothetical protein LZ24_02456 [Desulfobotulus alkaliphilus]|uniref:Uncharacterized protein n=1 Tax=Desulfobotulus alkaliphilus TaxID=622671 RepID=A0A562RJP5_9BACT|nr:hypothetical protein [Desulfobotulus alkaliphilus]TWI68620.1 hypothetical protein LZ24_02456 [Desulfobotulus alkaliphilus]